MYVISYSRGTPVVMQSEGAEDRLRQMCEKLAQQGYAYVTLHSLDDNGVIAPIAQWLSENGASTPEPEVWPAVPESYDEEISQDDEGEVYDGFCVKCREHRAFTGEIVEMSNGRRRAKGTCPICGTGISRILANAPLSDDFHTPDDEPDEESETEETAEAEAQEESADEEMPEQDDEAIEAFIREQHSLNREATNRGTHLTCACGEWDKWVTRKTEKAGREQHEKHVQEMVDNGDTVDVSVEAAPGTPIEEVAAEVAQVAEELAKPVKATRSRKGAKKATASKVTDAEIEAVKNMKVATCPQCGNKVPVMERGGLDIFTLHPNAAKNLDRCPGSTTTV